MGKNGVVLKDHARVSQVGGNIIDHLLIDGYLPAVLPVETGYGPQKGRFAAPGRAEQGKELPGAYLQVDIIQGLYAGKCLVYSG